MGLSDITLILIIALILFGPEDLPDIARAIGKIVYEIRKAVNDLTNEFQEAVDTPKNIMNKAFEQTMQTNKPVDDTHDNEDNSESIDGKVDKDEEELLTYNEETAESSTKAKSNPLAELPSDMVSYEEKGSEQVKQS